MLPREPSAVRPPACKLLGFPALLNNNSPPQLIALSTAYPQYSLNTALQSSLLREIRLNIAIIFSLIVIKMSV